MSQRSRAAVWERAGGRCEYCGVRQVDAPFVRFHVEHIVPVKHGGGDSADNLALACDRCNLHKGPNLTGIDSESGEIAALFDPRHEDWDEHFGYDGPLVVGLTPTGRASVAVLNMNAPRRVQLRVQLLLNGELG